jgi:hypothetical protein
MSEGQRGHSAPATEAVVLIGYASTMEAVQSFEWALKRLAINANEVPDDISFDEAWKRTEKLLRRPMGHLGERLPPELAENFARLKRIRNQLAHEILLRWRFETNLGIATHDEVAEGLAEIAVEYEDWAEQLDRIADEQMREKGLDPDDLGLTREDVAELLRGKDQHNDGPLT